MDGWMDGCHTPQLPIIIPTPMQWVKYWPVWSCRGRRVCTGHGRKRVSAEWACQTHPTDHGTAPSSVQHEERLRERKQQKGCLRGWHPLKPILFTTHCCKRFWIHKVHLTCCWIKTGSNDNTTLFPVSKLCYSATIFMADILDVSHQNSHESVQPLSHWVGCHSHPGGVICWHVLILTRKIQHTHGLSRQEERNMEMASFYTNSKLTSQRVITEHLKHWLDVWISLNVANLLKQMNSCWFGVICVGVSSSGFFAWTLTVCNLGLVAYLSVSSLIYSKTHINKKCFSNAHFQQFIVIQFIHFFYLRNTSLWC